jgi:hypothetical protein
MSKDFWWGLSLGAVVGVAVTLLVSCSGAMERDPETGAPVGWLAKAVDTVEVVGETATKVVDDPSMTSLLAGIFAAIGGVVTLWKGGKVTVRAAVATKRKTMEVLKKKINGG